MAGRRAPTWIALACAIALGCAPDAETLPPIGHVLLHVDTDAPVPPPPGVQPDPAAPPPLFDRLLVEILPAGEAEPCPGCTRELELDEAVLRAGGSFAVEPHGGRSGIRVRLRMFRAAGRLEGDPPPEATVEATILLPDIPNQGRVDAHVLLPTEGVGSPAGSLDAPIPAGEGAPGSSQVGTWPGARRIDCAEPPGPGEVCIPGGAFWMGNPLADDVPMLAATLQRLVVVSPFYLDAREATVASYRAAGVPPGGVVFWSGGSQGDAYEDWCTYPSAPDPARDPLPVSCVTWDSARAYCKARGADLPTEAQAEYVGGGLQSSLYVWGLDQPRCSDAIWSRARSEVPNFGGFHCAQDLPPGEIGGPEALPEDAVAGALGSPRLRDWLAVPTGDVFDLAGNLAEWSLDRYSRQDEPCWSHPGVFVDPLCDAAGVDGDLRATRGGSWGSDATGLLAARRQANPPDEAALGNGIRCARHAVPAP